MFLSDYHLHTEYSFDSREKMRNVCEKASAYGMKEICFCEHYELGIDDAGECPDFEKRDQEIAELQKEFANVVLLRGIELGQAIKDLPRASECMAKNVFDFVIGSLHVVGDYGRPSKYDFSIESNYLAFFRDYFREIKELAVASEYDVIGHITFPFRYATSELLAKYPIEGYKNDILELLEIIIGRDKGIEINTSGLRMPVLTETLPNLMILQWYKDLGGKIVTVGSDGHSARSAFSGIETGYDVLIHAGFSEVTLYRNRVPHFCAI